MERERLSCQTTADRSASVFTVPCSLSLFHSMKRASSMSVLSSNSSDDRIRVSTAPHSTNLLPHPILPTHCQALFCQPSVVSQPTSPLLCPIVQSSAVLFYQPSVMPCLLATIHKTTHHSSIHSPGVNICSNKVHATSLT